jgi:hypothetical protein
VFEEEGVEVQQQPLAHLPPLATRHRTTAISVVSEAPVAAVRAVEEDALASVQVAPVRSCGAPSPRRSAAKLGPSFDYVIRP